MAELNPILEGLETYVEQRREPLVSRAVLGARTLDYITIQTDIKTSAAVNVLDSDPKFQDGSECGFTADGSSKLSQRVIETGQIKVNQEFCNKKMLPYWTQYRVRVAADNEELAFGDYFVGGILDKVNEKLDRAIWQGTKAVDMFDGFVTILAADENVIKPTVTGLTAYEAIKKVKNSIPANIKDKAAIFVGADTFEAFIDELTEKNLYHHTAGDGTANEYFFPASRVKVIAVNGLNGSKAIVAGNPEQMYYGTDLENGQEIVDVFFDKSSRTTKVVLEWNSGVQYAFSDEMVYAVLN